MSAAVEAFDIEGDKIELGAFLKEPFANAFIGIVRGIEADSTGRGIIRVARQDGEFWMASGSLAIMQPDDPLWPKVSPEPAELADPLERAAAALERIANRLEILTDGDASRWYGALMDLAHNAGKAFQNGMEDRRR